MSKDRHFLAVTFESLLINYPVTRRVNCPMKTIILTLQKKPENDLGLLLNLMTSKLSMNQKMEWLDDDLVNQEAMSACHF